MNRDPLHILHVDMDAYYAAVEVLDQPSLRGKPVIVGGVPGSRGVVCSATYEARAFGVKAAMPMAQAQRLCPTAVFLPGRHARYAELSRRIVAVFRSFTPCVEPLSLDEAFLDVRGCERLFGDGVQIARRIKQEVRSEIGLVASVGVSCNKFLAKLASDLGKPDGLMILPEADIEHVLAPLSVSHLWGVGPRTAAELERVGLRTIRDLRRAGLDWLRNRIGPGADQLMALAWGRDDRAVESREEARSIGAERTFDRNLTQQSDLEAELLALSEEVGERVRAAELCARTVQIKVRFPDFRTVTRRRTLVAATDITREVYEVVRELLRERVPMVRAGVRLLGVQLSQFERPGAGQILLFGDPERERERRLDQAVDALRERLGDDAVQRARRLSGGG